MSVFLRVDDFPGTKPAEFWKHNLENFKKFDEVLARNSIQQYLVGVIPRHVTEEQLEYLRSNDRIISALHGVDHDERFPNEFRDWETEDQVFQKLTAACDRLRLGTIQDYIPPHNVVDRKTVNALVRAGFKRLYGGPGSDQAVLKYAEEKGLVVYFSEHPVWYGRSDELLHRDNSPKLIAEQVREGLLQVLTLHWTWECNIGFEHLDAYLKQVAPFFA